MMILHDYTESTDGGSRLCFILARGLNAPLVLGSVRRNHPYLTRYADVRVHTLAPHLPFQLVRVPVLAACFLHRTPFIATQDTVIYSGTYAPLAVLHHPAHQNILYCHTPPRFLYDDHEAFAAAFPSFLRPTFRKTCETLRSLYATAIERMDMIIANSETVRERIQRIFGKNALVIHPPCGDASAAISMPVTSPSLYLSLSRLDPLKRLDVLINAFRELPNSQLVLTSSGPEEERLRRMAQGASNITFTGMLSDAELHKLLCQCTATLCVAKDEDFGMCAAESLAFGKPVIAAGTGGLAEIVRHEQTGLLLSPDPQPDDVRCAVKRLDTLAAAAMREACLLRAKDFSVPRFVETMRQAVSRCTGEAA